MNALIEKAKDNIHATVGTLISAEKQLEERHVDCSKLQQVYSLLQVTNSLLCEFEEEVKETLYPDD